MARFARALALAPSRVLARQNLAAALGKLAMDRDSSYLESAVGAYDRLLQVFDFFVHTVLCVFHLHHTVASNFATPLEKVPHVRAVTAVPTCADNPL